MMAVMGIGTIGALMLVPCCLRRGAGIPAAARLSITRAATRHMTEGGHAGQYIDSIDVAASALRAGKLCAFPTETVYGLGAHAFDGDAVASIFTVKGRPRSDPLIVHVASADAAEELVRLDADGLSLMRQLMASFWPGPLTLVAPAVPELPPAVTAGTGFVGVRVPDHRRAIELLKAAAVPVAAPSANRFGHVSPTRPEHVMADLGAHPIFVLMPEGEAATTAGSSGAAAETCCDVGIESTVLKVDAVNRELLLLRRGGVPEAELQRWLDATTSTYTLRVQPPKHAAPPPLPPQSSDDTADAAADTPGQEAPGMSLTHYAPDLPSFLVGASAAGTAGAAGGGGQGALTFDVRTAVVLDFGARLVHLKPRAKAYRDLSAGADACEAATSVFDALRWAEGEAANGAKCVLLPNVDVDGPQATSSAAAAEHVPALSDRLYRAASGRSARLGGDGSRIVVDTE